MTIKTLLGNVKVHTANMDRRSGYGQYTITIYLTINGASEFIKYHSTDSQLFDLLTDLDNNRERSDFLIVNQKSKIEREVNDFVNSL